MAKINRIHPKLPCTIIFSDDEWKPLYIKINKNKKIPKKTPSVNEAIRWMAQLGGFLGRKADGEPGITTIWRGWQELKIMSEDYLLFSCG